MAASVELSNGIVIGKLCYSMYYCNVFEDGFGVLIQTVKYFLCMSRPYIFWDVW